MRYLAIMLLLSGCAPRPTIKRCVQAPWIYNESEECWAVRCAPASPSPLGGKK